MFGREQLERCTVKKWVHSEWEINPDENGEFFWADDVNPVLDKMESRINELTAENAKLEDDWQKAYADECVTRHENHRLVDRIEELESKIADIQRQLDAAINEVCQKKSVIRSLQNELSLYNEQYSR